MVLACALPFLASSLVLPAEFIVGADFSHLQFFEDRGIVYQDEQGPRDALSILRGHGLNWVRLRLFTSNAQQASADPYNATNNLDYTVPLAVRVKSAGLQFLLDLHYSDSWADPGKQNKPSDWATLIFDQLEERVYEYTRDVVTRFRQAGAAPDIVQVGNEIIGGLLWPEGRVGGSYDSAHQWSQLGRLLKSAILGVREGAGGNPPRILIHIDRGADWGATQWFFDRLLQEQVDFDLIGQSYYPFWHGSLDQLRACLLQTGARYQKPILIIETAFPWSGSTNVVGIPPTPAGQAEFVLDLAKALRAVPAGRGLGIVWWGSEYVRLPGYGLAGFDRRSLFDFDGRAMPVVDALGRLTEAVRLQVVPSGAGLILTWPLGGAGMVLTTTPNLSTPGDWSPVNVLPLTDGLDYRTTLPQTDPVRFYRLETD
jgi:arabinogalactan endo-1,4-beta-galactosidase